MKTLPAIDYLSKDSGGSYEVRILQDGRWRTRETPRAILMETWFKPMIRENSWTPTGISTPIYAITQVSLRTISQML